MRSTILAAGATAATAFAVAGAAAADIVLTDAFEDFGNRQSLAIVGGTMFSDGDTFDANHVAGGVSGSFPLGLGKTAQAYNPITGEHSVAFGNDYTIVGGDFGISAPIGGLTSMASFGNWRFFCNGNRFAVFDDTTQQSAVYAAPMTFIGGMCAVVGPTGEMLLLVGSGTSVHQFELTGDYLTSLGFNLLQSDVLIGSSIASAGINGLGYSDGRVGVATLFGNATGAISLAAPPACPGDIADDFGTLPPLGGPDGMVSFGDFLALLGLVGPCPGGPPPPPGCTGDIADDFGTLGEDGMVSFGDFLALLGLVGPCP